MKEILTVVSVVFLGVAGFSQDSKTNSKWGYLDKYELSAYAITIRHFNGFLKPCWGGNEVNLGLFSYETARNEISVSSGFFFIDKRPEKKSDPHLQYFYLPIYLNYKIYSKNHLNYGRVSIGTPLYLNEDSKYLDRSGKFWLNYDDLSEQNRPNLYRKKIIAMGQLRYGRQLNEHLSLNVGAITYIYSYNKKNASTLIQLAAGIEYKL